MPAWPEFRRPAAGLADGRALTYHDRPGAPERTRVDQRPLDPVAATSELRRDELTGEWVIVAGHRQDRTFLPTQATGCPLCASRPGNPTEVPEDDYEVAVFDNRFPSLTPDAVGDLSSDRRPGFGRCEVVCFTSQHDLRLADLDSDRVLLVVRALIDVVQRVRSGPRGQRSRGRTGRGSAARRLGR